MSLQDTRDFLEDLLTRFDPTVDLSDGSRAQTQLIEPLLTRLGPDPFDEDVATFLRERIKQVFPNLSITEADGLADTLISPLRVLLEPISREVQLIKLRSSLLNIGSLSDAEADALLANMFEPRRAGAFSSGVVRIYFASPISVSATIANPVTSRGGLRYIPTVPQSITAAQMLLNPDGTEYYFDVNYTAEKQGTDYDIDPANIVSIANMPAATRVTNLRRFRGGSTRETTLDYAARVQQKLSDRTLTISRGIASELYDNFPTLRKLQVIGFNDPEMERDVVKGGSLGPVLPEDSFGPCFGTGSAVDDLDADTTSPLFNAPTGFFVSRVGSVGAAPEGYFLSLMYSDGVTPVAVDAEILEVVSGTEVRIDAEVPLSVATVFWSLRRRQLTISDIPGGISLPDTADGEITITSDSVHIGGKTDVYVAGPSDEASATITGLSDESPAARGTKASTNATTLVTIPGADWIPVEPVETLMTFVLEEGVDAGSYQIREITSVGPDIVLRLDSTMTGTQSNLNWKIVDDIDQELTSPKDIKITGSDLLTVAGNSNVTTAGSTNFLDANVQVNDTLRILNDSNIGGDYRISAVGAVILTLDPAPTRTVPGASYVIFRGSEAIDTPVLRVKSLELLDSAGAPVGITIPYRDPVVALSRGFQNEGSGFLYEGPAIVGLVSTGFTGSLAVGTQTLSFDIRDPKQTFRIINQFTFAFSAGSKTAAQMATELNADVLVSGFGIRATVITAAGLDYLALSAPADYLVQLASTGTANTLLGFSTTPGRLSSTARIRPLAPASFLDSKIQTGHRLEFLEGRNRGYAKVIQDPVTGSDNILLGTGPLGPAGTTGLYDQRGLSPDVGVKVRIGRASIGTARVYFLDPTSAEFDYATTRASLTKSGRLLEYQPDPENTRQLIPAPPLTQLPNTGVSAPPGVGGGTLTDASTNFQELGVKPGDLLEMLYVPITGTVAFGAPPVTVAVSGLTLYVSINSNPFIGITFATNLTRTDLVDYINAQVGEDIASLNVSNNLVLASDTLISVRNDSTALAVLGLASAPRTNVHPEAGTYVITAVNPNSLNVAVETPFALTTTSSRYRIRRYLQRISSTEMNTNTDESGLYFVDVEMVALGPGDGFNLSIEDELEITGHRSDGYRLRTESEVTSFSRAEKLFAEISRSILLVGSSDSPAEYVQLSTQNVLVSYDRSQLVDDIQSFCDADSHRVTVAEMLVRHLLPHYVRVNWKYVSGDSEATMRKAIEAYLDTVDPDERLEVSNVVKVLTSRGAVSVYAVDPDSSTGRTAPLLVVIYHGIDRRIRASIVRDFAGTSRTQRFLPDTLTLSRTNTGGIR